MNEEERLTIGCMLRYLIVFLDEHYILIVSSSLMAPLYVYICMYIFFIVSVLLYLYLSVSLFACLYITILSVLPEWRINFIV